MNKDSNTGLNTEKVQAKDLGMEINSEESLGEKKEVWDRRRVIGFVWQHVLLLIALDIMTLGVALSVKSNLGSSVISTIPYVLSLAGADGMAPRLSIGGYTIMMNALFVGLQLLVLRRRFQPVQLFQLVIGFFFGSLIDFNVFLVDSLTCTSLWAKVLCQLAGCTVLGIGIAFEVRCGSVTMPGEGITIAVSQVSGRPFPKVKMMIDTALVALAVAGCYFYYDTWRWEVIGVGTLVAMLYVGYVVKLLSPHLGWFDRLLRSDLSPRHIYGLLRHRD